MVFRSLQIDFQYTSTRYAERCALHGIRLEFDSDVITIHQVLKVISLFNTR